MQSSQPNVILILIDDLGCNDLSCQGSTFYETPNIDGIAKDGIQYTQAYASCPVCSPSRASLLTGKYPSRVGITQWIGGSASGKLKSAPYLKALPLGEISIAKRLQSAGYRTYHVGKWHLGGGKHLPTNHGFEINIGGSDWGHPWKGYFSPYHMPNLKDGPDGEYLTDRLTNEAIRLIEQNDKKPFFLNLSYYAVHTPIQVPEEEILYFQEKAKKMGLDAKNPYEIDSTGFYIDFCWLDEIQRRVVQSDPKYAAMLFRLDKNIGKILTRLDELGISDNTIVIFTSDNGGLSDGRNPPTSNSPLRTGKSYLYEGGMRVPLLIKWPKKIQAGSLSNWVVTTPDLYPTLLECCGLELDIRQHVDGRSVFQTFNTFSSKQAPRPIFWHYPHYNGNGAYPGSAVIEWPWKLIEWHEETKYELFNLEKDPSEMNNVSLEYPEKVKIMINLLNAWKNESGAIMPLRNPKYKYWVWVARIRRIFKKCIKTSHIIKK